MFYPVKMKYKLFFTPMCPKCHSVREFMGTTGLEGEEIDAATPDGLEEAKKFDVSTVPTVVFLENDEVKNIAHDVEEVKRVIDNKSLV